MGNIGPSGPSGGDYVSKQTIAQQAQEAAASAKWIREEIEIAALSTFFASLDANSGQDDSSSKGKINKIEKEVKEGAMTPTQAAAAMLAIVGDSTVPPTLKLPPIDSSLDLTQPKSQLLMHTEFFSLYVDQNVKSGAVSEKLLNQTVTLANQIAGDRIPLKEAAQTLTNLITQVNQDLPRTLQYPKVGPRAFGV